MDLDDIEVLFRAIRNIENEDFKRLLKIAIFTGRRRNELLLIERRDVNIEKVIFRAVNIKSQDKHKESLEIPNEVLDDFEYFLSKNPNDKQPFKICHPNIFTHWTKDLFRKANLSEDLHLHSLRHTVTTLAARNRKAKGGNLYEAYKSIMGIAV